MIKLRKKLLRLKKKARALFTVYNDAIYEEQIAGFEIDLKTYQSGHLSFVVGNSFKMKSFLCHFLNDWF